MSGSYSQGAHKLGSTFAPDRDTGTVTVHERVKVSAGGAASADFTTYLPMGAALIDVLLDTVLAHTSATATVSGGTTVGGTELFPATDVKAGGRVRPVFTAAELLRMQSMPKVDGQSDSPVYLRLALTTPTSVGETWVNLIYSLD